VESSGLHWTSVESDGDWCICELITQYYCYKFPLLQDLITKLLANINILFQGFFLLWRSIATYKNLCYFRASFIILDWQEVPLKSSYSGSSSIFYYYLIFLFRIYSVVQLNNLKSVEVSFYQVVWKKQESWTRNRAYPQW